LKAAGKSFLPRLVLQELFESVREAAGKTLPSVLRIASRRQCQRKGHQTLRRKAGIHIHQAREAFDQQARSGHQHEHHPHFRRDQKGVEFPNASVRIATAANSGFFLNTLTAKRKSCQSVCMATSHAADEMPAYLDAPRTSAVSLPPAGKLMLARTGVMILCVRRIFLSEENRCSDERL
jgi:hypothetical protein